MWRSISPLRKRCWRISLPACAPAKPWSSGLPVGTARLNRFAKRWSRLERALSSAANFSYGVNLFFQIVRAAAPALSHGYTGHITEIHHIHKKDAPSGTAATMQRILEQAAGVRVDITSEREGEVTGMHTLGTEFGRRPHSADPRSQVAPNLCRRRRPRRRVDRGPNRLLRIQRHLHPALVLFTTETPRHREGVSLFLQLRHFDPALLTAVKL